MTASTDDGDLAAGGQAYGKNETDEPRTVVIPYGVRLTTAWSWRFLVIAAAVAIVVVVVTQLRLIVVPVALAALVTALVIPVTDRLARRMPRGLAAALTVVGLLVVVLGLLTLVGQQIASGFGDLLGQVQTAVDQIHGWLVHGPLHLSDNQIVQIFDGARKSLNDNRSQLTQGALRVGTTAGHVVAGFFLALFATIFFLYQGGMIWAWLVRLFPRTARLRADGAGRNAWRSLTAFVRATVLVALVDAIGITIVALILRVPLALPIGVLVFLTSFIPIVGAVLSGAVAVLVALVAHGPIVALVMLGGVLLVQQVESHVLQPFLMGRLVRLHPLAVVLAIGAGGFLGGIVGALFAVPTVAVLNGVAAYLTGRTPPFETAQPTPTEPGGSAPGGSEAPDATETTEATEPVEAYGTDATESTESDRPDDRST